MSETTPRPDETPSDPTAPPPPPPAPSGATVADAPLEPQPAAPAAGDEQPAYQQPTYQQPAYQQPAYQQQQGYPQPPPSHPPAGYAPTVTPLDPSQERQWGMFGHLFGLIGMVTTGILGFVATLVVYLVYKDRGPFVRAHTANSLNVQITALIGFVIGGITVIFIIGIFILIAVFIWAAVVHVIGAMKANNGEWYDPPLAITFVK